MNILLQEEYTTYINETRKCIKVYKEWILIGMSKKYEDHLFTQEMKSHFEEQRPLQAINIDNIKEPGFMKNYQGGINKYKDNVTFTSFLKITEDYQYNGEKTLDENIEIFLKSKELNSWINENGLQSGWVKYTEFETGVNLEFMHEYEKMIDEWYQNIKLILSNPAVVFQDSSRLDDAKKNFLDSVSKLLEEKKCNKVSEGCVFLPYINLDDIEIINQNSIYSMERNNSWELSPIVKRFISLSSEYWNTSILKSVHNELSHGYSFLNSIINYKEDFQNEDKFKRFIKTLVENFIGTDNKPKIYPQEIYGRYLECSVNYWFLGMNATRYDIRTDKSNVLKNMSFPFMYYFKSDRAKEALLDLAKVSDPFKKPGDTTIRDWFSWLFEGEVIQKFKTYVGLMVQGKLVYEGMNQGAGKKFKKSKKLKSKQIIKHNKKTKKHIKRYSSSK